MPLSQILIIPVANFPQPHYKAAEAASFSVFEFFFSGVTIVK
jgi:hypothetical protein